MTTIVSRCTARSSRTRFDEADVVGFLGVVAHDDFDDVETEPDVRIAEQPQVIERDLGDVALFLAFTASLGTPNCSLFLVFTSTNTSQSLCRATMSISPLRLRKRRTRTL